MAILSPQQIAEIQAIATRHAERERAEQERVERERAARRPRLVWDAEAESADAG